MISQTAEYALRAMVSLASDPGAAKTARQLSQSTRVPSGYLPKILRHMVRAGLVRSQRGPHGGFILDRTPEQISALDVIEAVDPLRTIDHCPLGNPTHGDRLCALHRRISQAQELLYSAFRESTLLDLLDPPGAGAPACRFPAGSPGPSNPNGPETDSPKKEDSS